MKLQNCCKTNSFFSMNCREKLYDLNSPKIMGILNLTPDSFSDGGKYNERKRALVQAEIMLKQGAEIIDIGAQSTRPHAEYLSAEEEIIRIGSVISSIKKEFPEVLISLDTFYADVVNFGYNEGMDIVNDISGGMFDEKMFKTVGETGLPYILMHVNSSYELMHKSLIDGDIILNINQYFSERIAELQKFGVKDIILDPGFGFGKTVEQQHLMIDDLQLIGFGNYPLLVGISRKSFIYKPLGKQPLEVNEETQKLHRKILDKGAKIIRVHDVSEAKKILDFYLKS